MLVKLKTLCGCERTHEMDWDFPGPKIVIPIRKPFSTSYVNDDTKLLKNEICILREFEYNGRGRDGLIEYLERK